MDTELSVAISHVTLARKVMEARAKRLAETRTKLSRHYNRVRHTKAMIDLLEELGGVLEQDPDKWDDEPELIPF